MKKRKVSSRLLLLSLFFVYSAISDEASTGTRTTPTDIHRGFSAVPDPSISAFQTLLADPTSEFCLAFLRVGGSHLELAVVHSPSGEPVWVANPDAAARWSPHTTLSFDGDLVLSDARSGANFWSSSSKGKGEAAAAGESLRLRGGNLQVIGTGSSVLWQSFDFPTDTLLENQNFTFNMTLRSSNGLYAARVEHDYLGLFAESEQRRSTIATTATTTRELYWKRTAMQAKAQIVPGLGPIYARVDPDGFLGVYQTEKAPLDVLAFSTYYKTVAKGSRTTRRLRMESDGNLRAHYWNSGEWVLDFSAIQEPCGLPSECGPYGLCYPDGAGCACLDDRVQYGPGGCAPEYSAGEDDLCDEFRVVRRTDVDLKYKKLAGSADAAGSAAECWEGCVGNCGCWAAMYSNSSGVCYRVELPVRTVVASSEVGKVAFFKVRRRRREKGVRVGVAGVLGLVAGTVALGAAVGLGAYGVRRWRRRRKSSSGLLTEDGLEPGPYRDLNDGKLQSGVELCNRK